MFCTNCGFELTEGNSFCENCGKETPKKHSKNINIKSNKMKAIIAGLVVVLGIFLFSFGSNENIDLVQDGNFTNYPYITVKDGFHNFFSNPKWEYFESEDGYDIVEFTGGVTYQGEDAKALIQFAVYEDDSFEALYLSLNDIAQNQLMLSSLIDKIMSEY